MWCSLMVNYSETDSYLLDNHRLTKCCDRHSPSPDHTKSEPNIDVYDWFRFGLDWTKNQCPWMSKSRAVWNCTKKK